MIAMLPISWAITTLLTKPLVFSLMMLTLALTDRLTRQRGLFQTKTVPILTFVIWGQYLIKGL